MVRLALLSMYLHRNLSGCRVELGQLYIMFPQVLLEIEEMTHSCSYYVCQIT